MSAGKTCIGGVDFSVPDADLIEEDIFDEYVFESGIVAEATLWRCPKCTSI